MFRNRKFNKGFIVMPLVLLISATAVFLLYAQDDEAEIVRGKWSYYKTPKLTNEEISKSALQSVMINFELLGAWCLAPASVEPTYEEAIRTPFPVSTRSSPAVLPSTPVSLGIILADGPGGLKLVSAPTTVPITVGHVAYLPVEVQAYHRPLTVSAQTLIHTYVNDQTPSEPGDSPPFAVGTLQAASSEIKLQTLRMRPHNLTLMFAADGQAIRATLALSPTVQPLAPLFGAGFIPTCPDCFWGGLSEPYRWADNIYGNDCRPCATRSVGAPSSPILS